MTGVDRLVAVFETLNEGHRRQVVWLAEELFRWEQRHHYPQEATPTRSAEHVDNV